MTSYLTAEHDGNPRYVLRAFEHTNPVRTAFLIKWFTRPAEGDPSPTINRSVLIDSWKSRYPRHAAATGRRRISYRVSQSLHVLKAAGIIDYDLEQVTVLSPKLLAMAADNLEIVEGPDGTALPPSRWSQRPACPPELLTVQDVLEESRVGQR